MDILIFLIIILIGYFILKTLFNKKTFDMEGFIPIRRFFRYLFSYNSRPIFGLFTQRYQRKRRLVE